MDNNVRRHERPGNVKVEPHTCIVCSTGDIDHLAAPDYPTFLDYLRSLCEVLGLKEQQDVTFEKFGELGNGIWFCSKCRHRLEAFRDIQVQLELLTSEISVIKDSLSKDFSLSNFNSDGIKGSSLRDCLRNEYELRHRQIELSPSTHEDDDGFTLEVTHPSPAAPSYTMCHDHEDFEFSHFEFPSQINTPISPVTNAVKPCCVKLTRVDATMQPRRISRYREHKGKLQLTALVKTEDLKTDDDNDKEWEPPIRSKATGQKTAKRKGSLPSSNNIPSNKISKTSISRKHASKSSAVRARLPFHCPRPKCSARYRTEEKIQFHIRRKHEGNPKPYYCSQCSAKYESLSKLRGHERKEWHGLRKKTVEKQPSTRFPLACPKPYCPSRLRTEEQVRFHVRRIHKRNPNPYNCFECEAEFGLLRDLRGHERETNHRSPTIDCPTKIPKTGTVFNARFPFRCPKPQCCARYRTEEQVQFHVRRKHDLHPNPYYCLHAECSAEFDSLFKLRIHGRKQGHSGQSVSSSSVMNGRVASSNFFTLACPEPYCLRRLRTEESLRFHIRRIHERNPTPYNCSGCTTEFGSLRELRHHQGETHGIRIPSNFRSNRAQVRAEPKFLPCTEPNCSVQLPSKDRVRFHVRKEHEGRIMPFNCVTCSAEYRFLRILRLHEKESGHSSRQERVTVQCEKCNLKFNSRGRYQSHLSQAQGGDCNKLVKQHRPLPPNCTFDRSRPPLRRYMCGDCGKQLRSSNMLRAHVRTKHTVGFEVICEFCSKTFNRGRALESHKLQVHLEQVLASEGNSAEVLDKVNARKCEICQERFTSARVKNEHVARVHSKMFNWYCETCGVGKVTRAELERHVATVHRAEKRFECSNCGEKFVNRSVFKRHQILKHGNESDYKFKCEQCPKAFYEKNKLTRHILYVHRKNDPTVQKLKCDLCNYTGMDRCYMQHHIKTKKHQERARAVGKEKV